MDLALLSDTHLEDGADDLPTAFRDLIADADHTVHAGDLASRAVLADLRELAQDLTAVHGNADPKDVGLPTVDHVTVGGVTVVVTHGTYNPIEAAAYGHDALVMDDDAWQRAIADTARARTRAWDGEGIVGVGGHSHEVVDTTVEEVRLLNPGTATGATPEHDPTMMTATVEDGSLEVTVHEA